VSGYLVCLLSSRSRERLGTFYPNTSVSHSCGTLVYLALGSFQVRKRMEMKMRRLRQPRANGQLKMMR
jgi:hypothetical protein